MKKETIFWILSFVAFGFLGINVIGLGKDIQLVIVFILLLFLNNTLNEKALMAKESLIIAIFLFVNGMYSSSIHNQSIVSTFIAMRVVLCFPIMLYVISKMRIKREFFDKKFIVFVYIAVASGFLSILFPSIFITEENIDSFIKSKEIFNDIIPCASGFGALVFYYYLLFDKIKDKPTTKNLFLFSLMAVYILIVQNRSTMLVALPVFLLAIIKTKSKYKWGIIATIIVIAIPLSYNIISSLVEETNTQMTDSNYNRWNAMNYFFVVRDWNIVNTLVGHGVPCVGSKYLNDLLYVQENGNVFISDIGLLGCFFYYGLLIMIIIYKEIIGNVLSKRIPISLRLYSLWMLLVPTIHHFGFEIGSTFIIAIFLCLSKQIKTEGVEHFES